MELGWVVVVVGLVVESVLQVEGHLFTVCLLAQLEWRLKITGRAHITTFHLEAIKGSIIKSQEHCQHLESHLEEPTSGCSLITEVYDQLVGASFSGSGDFAGNGFMILICCVIWLLLHSTYDL